VYIFRKHFDTLLEGSRLQESEPSGTHRRVDAEPDSRPLQSHGDYGELLLLQIEHGPLLLLRYEAEDPGQQADSACY